MQELLHTVWAFVRIVALSFVTTETTEPTEIFRFCPVGPIVGSLGQMSSVSSVVSVVERAAKKARQPVTLSHLHAVGPQRAADGTIELRNRLVQVGPRPQLKRLRRDQRSLALQHQEHRPQA